MNGLELEPLKKLNKDLKDAAVTLSRDEARYVVDTYYQIQDFRKASNNQVRALSESEEPHSVLDWLATNMETLERNMKSALGIYAKADQVGKWAMSIVGIGPVISAGLLAHIDIEKAPTVGHIWRFAGLDPTTTWEKKQKRPWNAKLKTLCWKIGESFVKVSNREGDIYGKVYQARKELEAERNEAGQFAEQAKAKLERFKIGKATEAYGHYSSGKLPPAHIHARAKRYAVKLFLSHWHDKAYRVQFGKAPPNPYPIEHLGHAHVIPPPV